MTRDDKYDSELKKADKTGEFICPRCGKHIDIKWFYNICNRRNTRGTDQHREPSETTEKWVISAISKKENSGKISLQNKFLEIVLIFLKKGDNR